jgi:hypothetical protein
MILFRPRSNGMGPEARDVGTAPAQGGRPSGAAVLAAALSVGAGLIHAVAAGAHGGDATMVLLFAACAVAQVAVGAAAVAGKGRAALVSLAAVNLGAAAAWVASRTKIGRAACRERV